MNNKEKQLIDNGYSLVAPDADLAKAELRPGDILVAPVWEATISEDGQVLYFDNGVSVRFPLESENLIGAQAWRLA